MKYFVEELSGVSSGGLGSDLKAAMGYSRTFAEFEESTVYDDVIGKKPSESHLYGMMLAVLSRNLSIFLYLFEEVGIQFSESDIIKLLRLCLTAHWPAGFLAIVKS